MFHQPTTTCAAAGVRVLAKLHPDNVDNSLKQGEEVTSNGRGLGPWLLAVRQWLPPSLSGKKEGVPSDAMKQVQEKGKQTIVDASDSVPKGPSDDEGWSKPAKLAPRRSPLRPPISIQGGKWAHEPWSGVSLCWKMKVTQCPSLRLRRQRSPARIRRIASQLKLVQAIPRELAPLCAR